MTVAIVIAVVILIILIWFVATSNALNKAVVKIDEANSGFN